ncbi:MULTISPECIES: hypothetical protein [Ornithinibacillus]|uniref:Uncharacterized protein n=2 Tax=Ornithinibacillus TaxID=484508 RepID=A0A923RJH5_9BACI|nr:MULTISPECIES: hypothetical protein [Ornithinibacillus]MBC5638014.1 hypothetical protein [Ornithinibacillus hominis]MBS3681902.1 hypothetical protein [Ornithinibacillus massiliensis]
MVKVVIANLKKVQLDREVVRSLDGVSDQAVLMDWHDVSWDELGEHDVFVPASLLDSIVNDQAFIYHELSLYPFFQEIKARIIEDGSPSGVFRFRRVVDEAVNSAIITSDLCVLESIFGQPGNLVLKRSNEDVVPHHVILMVQYKKVIAHIEYTFSGDESIQIEWSGALKMIEFHSDERTSLKPGGNKLPLSYRIDSILTHSKKYELVIGTFNTYQKQIEMGG